MSFTVPSHITVTFDEYNVPDIQSLGKDFNGANLAKEVWFSFPLETLTAYTVIVNAKREDKSLTYRVCNKKTVDGVVYDYFPLDSWFTAKSGRVIMAVKVYKSSDISVAEDGTVTLVNDEPMIVVSDLFALTVNYAPNAISLEPALDPSDVEIIYASIGMKASKSEVPLVVASLPTDLDTLVDGAYKYDNWIFMLTDGTIYRIDEDTAVEVGKIVPPTSDKIGHIVTPTYYTAATQTVKDNLIGIDTKLGVIDARTLAGTLLSTNITATQLTALINEATTSLKGLMSATDKTNLNTLVALLANNDGDSVINTVTEILAIFSTYPEGVNIVTALATKVDKTQTINAKPLSGNITLDKTDIGLPNVDNTSDVNKPVSTAQAAAIATKADKLYAINLVANGNFASTTGWLSSNSTLSAASNILSATGNGAAANTSAYQSVSHTSGHKYYIRALVSVTNAVCSYISLYIGGETGAGVQTSPAQNTYYALSTIITATSTASKSVQSSAQYADVSTQNGKVMNVKYFVEIDLTALQGAGNEWSVERMDKYMAYKYANSWIDNVNTEFKSQADDIYWNAMAIKATNIIVNSNFTIAWSVTNATTSVANNEATVLASATNGGIVTYPTLLTGHKYFAFAWVKSDSSLVALFEYNISGVGQIFSNGSNAYQFISVTGSALGTSGAFKIIDTRTSGWTNIYVKYAGLIDLTATYGAGKEPTVAQMNAKMAYFTNSWFDATANLENVMTLSNTKADKAQEAWIVPTLLSGVSVRSATGCRVVYRLNNFGVVEIDGVITSTLSGWQKVFTMPSGYRPPHDFRFSVMLTSYALAGAYINTAGEVYMNLTATDYWFNTSYQVA